MNFSKNLVYFASHKQDPFMEFQFLAAFIRKLMIT